MKILIIYGSIREGRQGIKAARFIEKRLKEKGHETVLIDPEQYQFPMFRKRYAQYGDEAPEVMKKVAGHIAEADGFVIVTGEYNRLPPPPLTNILDHYLPEWGFRPSAIISYSSGRFGGARATSHLRDMLAELGMPAIPSALGIGPVREFSDDGTPDDERYYKSADRLIAEFEWYMEAMKVQREKGLPY